MVFLDARSRLMRTVSGASDCGQSRLSSKWLKRVDYGHSNRSEATSPKSLEANTTSSERAPADAPRSARCCPDAKMARR